MDPRCDGRSSAHVPMILRSKSIGDAGRILCGERSSRHFRPDFYIAFALFLYASICQGVYARAPQRNVAAAQPASTAPPLAATSRPAGLAQGAG